ncbi:MAG: hypothetical protein Q9174_002741 [Haloplaca sp. 1 TL-2023]
MSGHITQGFLALVKTNSEKPPTLLRYRSSKVFILLTICTAVFTDIFLYGIIVPVIPFALTQRAGIEEADVQHWVSVLLAVYGAALLASCPLCGWIADRSTSRRLPLLVGLFALAAATLMLCFGHNIGVLLAGRLLQGVSAAIVWTVGLALLVDTVGRNEIGQVMGFVSIAMSVAILVAPLLGGVVYDRAGYYGVYYMSFALLFVDIVLRTVMIEKKIAVKWEKQEDSSTLPATPRKNEESKKPGQPNEPEPPSPDSALSVTLSEKKLGNPWVSKSESPLQPLSSPEGVSKSHSETIPATPDDKRLLQTSNQDTIEEQPEPRPDSVGLQECSPQAASDSESTPASSTKRRRQPILILLSSRRLLSALYCALVQSALMTAWDAVLPLRVNHLFGWRSLGAGLIFLPLVLPSFVAPLVGAFSDRYGARLPTSIGFVLSTPFVILLRVVDHNDREQVVILCVLLALLGVALTMVMTPLLAEVTYILQEKEKHHPGLFGEKGAYAQAYGLFNCAFAGGMLVGPLWAGSVVDKAGWGTMCLSLGVLALVSAIPAALFTNGWIGKRKRGKADEDQQNPPEV